MVPQQARLPPPPTASAIGSPAWSPQSSS